MGPLCINHTAQDESPEATIAWGIAECYKLFDIGCYLLSCESMAVLYVLYLMDVLPKGKLVLVPRIAKF